MHQVYELNIDGLVGSTHHYAGLSHGNIASIRHALTIANPQAAARQGLAKMRLLHNMGIKQAIFPPHQRPNLQLLHQLGITGTPKRQIATARHLAPELLSACYSASSMWTANMATVSASQDCMDNKVHFTAANLVSNLHRQQETGFSAYLLQRIFNDDKYFKHHLSLPSNLITSDEGAANYSRLCQQHNQPGINFFVYGKRCLLNFIKKKYRTTVVKPGKYPARQTYEASSAVVRLHKLYPDRVVFAHQNPNAIDQGVFHNDVIAVANESVLLVHEQAFLHQSDVFKELQAKANFDLKIIEVSKACFSIADAVMTYIFNSQLISLPNGSMVLIAPIECANHQKVKAFIDELLQDNNNPISQVHYFNLEQSMHNGGGPACLRLRVPLHQHELQAMHQGIIITNSLLKQLEDWVVRHYRTSLTLDDLASPDLIDESLTALDALSQLLNLGSIYPFQRE